jgi:hypothetical protein
MTTPNFKNSQLGITVSTDHPSFSVGSSGILFTDGSRQLTAFTGTALTNETDPIFTGSVAYNITSIQTGQWSQAYSWGDHSTLYATTGELSSVSGYLQSQIDAIPSDTNTFTSSVIYSTGDRNLILNRNDGVSLTGNFDVVLHSGDNVSVLVNDANYLVSGTNYHPNVSGASSSDNSGKTFIQDILLDTNGHVTGITAESSIPTRYDIKADGSTNTFTTEDSYILSRIDIFQNGVKLYDGEDFVATNGTSFTLNNTIPSGSLIEYIIDLSQTFNPASVSGLKMWVDADDGSTITNTAFGISQWNDKSSNGHHLAQSNTSHRPQLSTGALGARNVVNFNGTDERMVCDPIATGVFNGDQIPYSTVVVWRSTGSSTQDTIYAAANNSTTARVHYRVSTDGTPQYDAFRLDDSGDLKRLTDSYTHNTFIVASVTFGGSVFKHYTNGTNDDTATGSEDNTSVFNFTVGAAKVAGTFVEFLEGDIAELLIYDHELSDSDRINIENYLMSKWGIS